MENQVNNYRITFHDGPMGNRRKSVDVYAKNSDEAFYKAYQMPEVKSGRYTDVTVEEIPKEPSVIGIEFEYSDTAINQTFRGYLFIKANSEAEAIDYYNQYYKNGRFWFNAGKTEADGKCIRGRVLRTYFAGFSGYDADATKSHCNEQEKKGNEPLESKIKAVKNRAASDGKEILNRVSNEFEK